MLQSSLFTHTLREAPKGEEAVNAKLLLRGGFIEKVMAGVYSFLPLGLKVLNRIENIVREEMDAIGGQEILMPALHPKENWQRTDRWNKFDALLKVTSHFDTEFALGPTHEEIIVPLAKKFISSYKDLPFAAYQVQTKFRDEARSKSGLLRGREFRMKDLYSFHADPEDLKRYYEKVKQAYAKIFKHIGLETLMVQASGGTFSKYSHEFQVLSEAGEDTIYHCEKCDFAQNKEIVEEPLRKLEVGSTGICPACSGTLRVDAGIEVGNIFELNTRYSEPFDLTYKSQTGESHVVIMGCYGIGMSRIMGAVVEVSHDDRGIIWPESIAPFDVHLLELARASGKELYANLQKRGFRVLYDERSVSAGEKFTDADLLGIPARFLVSEKTGDNVEVRRRNETKAKLLRMDEAMAFISKKT